MEQHHINKKSVERALHELSDVPSFETEATAATTATTLSRSPTIKKKKKKKKKKEDEEDPIPPKIILFDDGWDFIQTRGLEKLKSLVEERYQNRDDDEAEQDVVFPREEAVEICTKIFVMCHQFDPYNHSQALYDRHGQTIKDYLRQRLVAEMEQATELPTPEESLTCWLDLADEFQFFTQWWNNFFRILDRVHAEPRHLPKVQPATWTYFQHNMVAPYHNMICQAVLYLIQNDREGQSIDMSLVSETIRIFKVLDETIQTSYMVDLEELVLETTREYYDCKRVEWNYHDIKTYFTKAFAAVEEEQSRVRDYLHQILSKPRPLEIESTEEQETATTESDNHDNPDAAKESRQQESSTGETTIATTKEGDTPTQHNKKKKKDNSNNKIHQIVKEELLDKAPIPVEEWNKRTEREANDKENPCNQYVPLVGIFARGRSRSRTRGTERSRSNSNSRGIVGSLIARGRSLSRERFSARNKTDGDGTLPPQRARGRSKPPLTRENNRQQQQQQQQQNNRESKTPVRRRFSLTRK